MLRLQDITGCPNTDAEVKNAALYGALNGLNNQGKFVRDAVFDSVSQQIYEFFSYSGYLSLTVFQYDFVVMGSLSSLGDCQES